MKYYFSLIVTLLRLNQWIKNLICFAGAFFTPGEFLSTNNFLWATITTISFCFASSTVYVINDICDIEKDKLHPKKKNRPLPSKKITIPSAIVICIFTLTLSLYFSYLCGKFVLSSVLIYFTINIVYSLWLKKVAIIDVFCISLGFILRLLAGVHITGDKISAWMLLCTFFVTLFLGYSKRRSELANSGEDSRSSLKSYSIQYLDFLITSSGVMTILSYAIFTVSGDRDPSLIITLLPVCFSIFYLIHKVQIANGIEQTEKIFTKDRVIIFCGISWLISFILISRISPKWFL